MNKPDRLWILQDKSFKGYTCYLHDYLLHSHAKCIPPQDPSNALVLIPSNTMRIENAFEFHNKLKAKRVADILNKEQGSGYKVKEIQI